MYYNIHLIISQADHPGTIDHKTIPILDWGAMITMIFPALLFLGKNQKNELADNLAFYWDTLGFHQKNSLSSIDIKVFSR